MTLKPSLVFNWVMFLGSFRVQIRALEGKFKWLVQLVISSVF